MFTAAAQCLSRSHDGLVFQTGLLALQILCFCARLEGTSGEDMKMFIGGVKVERMNANYLNQYI